MPLHFRSLPLDKIKLTDKFWTRWQKVLRDTTIEAEYRQLVETRRLANFANAAKGEGLFEGIYFNDSDVYKWLEAVANALCLGANARVERMREEVIGLIEAAQEPDGYLNTYFQIEQPDKKWTNLVAMHEMYCAGHLIEAGVADFECTGDRRLLAVAIKNADHILSVFGPTKRKGVCGHEELELAMLRLAKATGNQEYATFAKWQIEERGLRPSIFEAELNDAEKMALSPWMPSLFMFDGEYKGEYAQDHAPIREHTQVVGHAVRSMYLYIAATELLGDEEDPKLLQAMTRIWENLTTRRMYITGGIGPAAKNEGFTTDYDLPNLTAYAETCAAVGLVFWAERLLQVTGDSAYADILEKALYNGAISGISLSGDTFFYSNPLASRGEHSRVAWFKCACCPPNIARLLGSVGRYVAGVSDDGFYIHVPAGFEAEAAIAGTGVKIVTESNYPWSGTYKVRIECDKPVSFKLALRIPGWCDEFGLEVDGAEEQAEYENGYAVLEREWKSGDQVVVEMEMQPAWMQAHPAVLDNAGRVALTHGPLVYCLEQHELGSEPQKFTVDANEEPLVSFDKGLLEGVNTIEVPGWLDSDDFTEDLYAPVGASRPVERTAKFIPYYAWCNRGPNHMQVWLRY